MSLNNLTARQADMLQSLVDGLKNETVEREWVLLHGDGRIVSIAGLGDTDSPQRKAWEGVKDADFRDFVDCNLFEVIGYDPVLGIPNRYHLKAARIIEAFEVPPTTSISPTTVPTIRPFHRRVWLLVERLYLTVHGDAGQKPEVFIKFLKKFDIDYPGEPYHRFKTTKGLYTFMSNPDYHFAHFMTSVPSWKYLQILQEIIHDPDIQSTEHDNWNYYGEYISGWFPELLQRIRDAGLAIGYNKLIRRYTYDVALSFAGENRDYVEQVADALKLKDIKVFYDKYQKADLWGKNLYEHLDTIYRLDSRFVIMFVSKHYYRKSWPTHERHIAQARVLLEQNHERILVARFDMTEIPGLLPTIGYIDCNEETPTQLAELIRQKIENDRKREGTAQS